MGLKRQKRGGNSREWPISRQGGEIALKSPVATQATPDHNTFEKYRDTPPIRITIRLQNYAHCWLEVKYVQKYVYHDTPLISRWSGRLAAVKGPENEHLEFRERVSRAFIVGFSRGSS